MSAITVTYLGHAAFALDYQGARVVVDPYEDGSIPGLCPIRERAAAVYSSHSHADHLAPGTVELTGEQNPFRVSEFSCFHDDCRGEKRGPYTVRVFEAGGLRVAHLGDLGHPLTPELREGLRELDALLIPVGGYYTIDAATAAGVVQELQPKAVIPMHYRSEAGGYDVIAPIEDFLALLPSWQRLDSCRVEIDGQQKGVLVLRQQNAKG